MAHTKRSFPAPKQLWPNVKDITDLEYGDRSNWCGEVFAGFKLQDLMAPLLSPVCVPYLPNTNPSFSSDIDHSRRYSGKGQTKCNDIRITNESSRPAKTESVTMDATRGEELSENKALEPPMKDTLYGQSDSGACKFRASRLDDTCGADNDNDGNYESHPLLSPPQRLRLHVRRRSRQLVNLFFVCSSSMSSSTKDMSIAESFNESPAVCDGLWFDDKYILTRRVLQCQDSEIWECLDKDEGIQYCVKIVDFPKEQAFAELAMHRSLSNHRHPGLVRLVESFQDRPKLYMVMEWVAGGNLLSKVIQDGPMEEDRVKDITRSLVQSCVFLHAQRVVLTNLEPSNVLLAGDMDSFPVKITDFGNTVDLSALQEPHVRDFRKDDYSAPEMMQKMHPYGTQVDMWSIGCLVYFMMTGSSPHEERRSLKCRATTTKNRIYCADYRFPSCHFENVSRLAKQFISSLIHSDPSVRMTAAEALEHPWLRVKDLQQRGFFHCRNKATVRNSPTLSGASVPNQGGHSPWQTSSNHHRRISSWTKGIGKLFSTKNHLLSATSSEANHFRTPSLPPLHRPSLFLSKSSSWSRGNRNCKRSISVRRWGPDSKARKQHRRLATS